MTNFKDRKKAWIEDNPLRKWRLATGLTQSDVADAVGMNFHTIYNWETGMASPSAKHVSDLSSLTKNKNLASDWVTWHQRKPKIKEDQGGRKSIARAVSGAGRRS